MGQRVRALLLLCFCLEAHLGQAASVASLSSSRNSEDVVGAWLNDLQSSPRRSSTALHLLSVMKKVPLIGSALAQALKLDPKVASQFDTLQSMLKRSPHASQFSKIGQLASAKLGIKKLFSEEQVLLQTEVEATDPRMKCGKGTYYNRQTPGCEECPANFFQAGGAAESCDRCSYGTYSAPRSGSCTQCPKGKYVSGEHECSDCTAGTYSDVLGAMGCTICNPGNGSRAGASECGSCAAGKYLTAMQECEDCPVGFYQNSIGQNRCEPCPRGSFQDQVGQIECAACSSCTKQNDFEIVACSPTEDTKCAYCQTDSSGCPANSYNPLLTGNLDTDCQVGSATCIECTTECPYGFFLSGTCVDSDFECTKCRTQCPHGRYLEEHCPSRNNECKACTPITCRPGQIFAPCHATANNRCHDCPMGYYGEGGLVTECKVCNPCNGTGQKAEQACYQGSDSNSVCGCRDGYELDYTGENCVEIDLTYFKKISWSSVGLLLLSIPFAVIDIAWRVEYHPWDPQDTKAPGDKMKTIDELYIGLAERSPDWHEGKLGHKMIDQLLTSMWAVCFVITIVLLFVGVFDHSLDTMGRMGISVLTFFFSFIAFLAAFGLAIHARGLGVLFKEDWEKHPILHLGAPTSKGIPTRRMPIPEDCDSDDEPKSVFIK